MPNFCVYKHTSPTGKVYIGITSQDPIKRWRGGRGYVNNEHLSAAIQKHGWANFKHEILADGLTQEAACDMEIALIKSHDSTNPEKGYNISKGGAKTTAGLKHSEAAKARMREARIAFMASPDARARIAESNRARTGTCRTAEAKQHISAALRGIVFTDEHKRNISAASKKKPVICVETGECFCSATEAARIKSLFQGSISNCCAGKTKTAGGYHWRYVKEKEENDTE